MAYTPLDHQGPQPPAGGPPPPPVAPAPPAPVVAAPVAQPTAVVPVIQTPAEVDNTTVRFRDRARDVSTTSSGLVIICVVLFAFAGLIFGSGIRRSENWQNFLIGALIGLFVGLAILLVRTFEGDYVEADVEVTAPAAVTQAPVVPTPPAVLAPPATAAAPGQLNLHIAVTGAGVPNATATGTIAV